MASRFLDFSPHVASILNVGTPIVAIETGFFMRLPYPKNLVALQECEQAFWRRSCVPCCMGMVNGRLKAGLTKEDMEALCRAGGNASRGELPNLAADKRTSGVDASATMAIAKLADIVPVMAPGLSDSLADMDALSTSARMVFCGRVEPDRAMLFAARSIAVLRQDEIDALTDAFLLQRDLELTECAVVPCGETLGDLAEKASAAALDLKKKIDFRTSSGIKEILRAGDAARFAAMKENE